MTVNKYIKLLLITTLCLISGKALGSSCYSKGVVTSKPDGVGKVYVSDSSVEGVPSWEDKDAKVKTTKTSSSSNDPYYFYADDTDDYHFLYWNEDSTLIGSGQYHEVYTSVTPTTSEDNPGTIEYNAHFTQWYKVTYKDGYNEVTQELFPKKYFKECTGEDYKFPLYSKPGYKFNGWKSNKNEGNWNLETTYTAQDSFSGKSYDVTLTAQWECIPYTITLKSDENDDNPEMLSYNIESTDITLPCPTKPAYDFNCWKVSIADGKWPVDTTFVAGKEVTGYYGNPTLTACWNAHSYKVSYDNIDSIDGWVENNQPLEYTIETTSPLPIPIKSGYTFRGWTAELDGDGNWDAESIYTKDDTFSGKWGKVTLIANWAIQYEVAYEAGEVGLFDDWEDGVAPSLTYTTYDDFSIPVPVKHGYDFLGWTAELDGDGNWDTECYYTKDDTFLGKWGNVTLTAQWEITTYTLTLDAAGGAVDPASIKYTIADNDTLPTPTLEGCTFKNWKVKEADGSWQAGDVYAAGTPVKGMYGSATLIAQWQGVVKISVTGLTSTEHHIIFTIDGPSGKFTVSVSSSESLKDLKAGEYTISETGWHKLPYSVEGPTGFTVADSAIELVFTATPNKDVKIGETAAEF